jgi:hypothetical protein
MVLATLAALIATPVGAVAQQRWSVDAGIVLARDLRHEGGPELGAVGGELRFLAPLSGLWAWGGSLAYHRFGRFRFAFARNFHEDRSSVLAGVRLRREALVTPVFYGEAGLNLVLGMEKPSDSDTGRDPGVGGYVGVGVIPRRRATLRPFAEIGLHGNAVTGESTDVGGVYVTVKVGLSF